MAKGDKKKRRPLRKPWVNPKKTATKIEVDAPRRIRDVGYLFASRHFELINTKKERTRCLIQNQTAYIEAWIERVQNKISNNNSSNLSFLLYNFHIGA